MPDAQIFGSRAFSFPPSAHDLLIADPGGAANALLESVRRRRRGNPFEVFADLAEPYAAIIPGAIETLAIVCRLADRVVVRSHAEHARLERALGTRIDRTRIALPESSIPMFARAEGPEGIVVWAPGQAEEILEYMRIGLREVHVPIVTIAQAHGERAVAALSNARAVILAGSCGPEDVLALVERGVAVATAASCGAEEYVDGVFVYEPSTHHSIHAAALGAFAAPAARRKIPPLRAVASATQAMPAQRPQVSLVVRTRNRPELLRTALQSAAAQSYAELEIIVVNDAGEDVRAIAESFPRVRYTAHDRQRGPNAAANSGLHLAQGVYAGLLDDDDVLFPDHIERLVRALETSGGMVAHSDALAWYFAAREGASYAVTGFKLFLDGVVIPSELYYTCPVLPLTVLARRTALAAVGGYPEDIPLMGDWDTFLRLAQRYDFVHVPRVTALYSIRDDASNLTADPAARFATSFKMIRERNAVDHRPVIHKIQLQMTHNREIAGKPVWPQPGMRIGPIAAIDLQ